MTEETPIQQYQCDKCAAKSTIKEAFKVEKKLLGGKRSLCFECYAKRQGKDFLQTFAFLLVLGLILLWLNPGGFLGKFYLRLGAFLLISIPLIPLHELAHTLTAVALGQRVFAVSLGIGKIIYSRRWRGIRWQLHQYPLGGLTHVAGPQCPDYRLRYFLITLAGPLLHVILFSILWRLLGWLPPWSNIWLTELVIMGLVVNAALFIGNIWPHKIMTSAGVTGTDGWVLLHIFSFSEAELQKRYAAYYLYAAGEAIELGNLDLAQQITEEALRLYPDNLMVINQAGVIASYRQQHQKSREIFLSLLESKEPLEEALKFITYNNIAFANIMLDDPTLLEEADRLSAEAYQNMSWEGMIIGTRGAVLVASGKIEEGVQLLQTSIAKLQDPKSKAVDACFIALGEIQRGNLATAQNYLDMAARWDADCMLLGRARAAMEAARTEISGSDAVSRS